MCPFMHWSHRSDSEDTVTVSEVSQGKATHAITQSQVLSIHPVSITNPNHLFGIESKVKRIRNVY